MKAPRVSMTKDQKAAMSKTALELANEMKWTIGEDGKPELVDSEATVLKLQHPDITQEQAASFVSHLDTVQLATRISGLQAIANDFPKETVTGEEFAKTPQMFDVQFADNITISATIVPEYQPKPVAGKPAGPVVHGRVIANSIGLALAPESVYTKATSEYSAGVAALFGKKD